MEKFTIPEKYREDFKRVLDKAVELGSFSDTTLAEELNISRLNAAIFIGFMDKYEFLFPSAKNEVKAVRISEDEWEKLGRDIERYVPTPIEDDKDEDFSLTPVAPITALHKRSIEVTAGGIMISDKSSSVFIPADEVLVPHFKKAGVFSRGFIYFGEERPKNASYAQKSASSIVFTRALNSKIEELVASLISDLESKL